MGRYPGVLLSGWIALVATTSGAVFAQDADEFVPPPNWIAYEDTGTLEGYRPGFIQIRDSKMQLWLLKIIRQTKVVVTGEAEVDYLKPGLSLEISGEINKKYEIEEPIEEIELLTAPRKPILGLFLADDDSDTPRPVRNPGPGAYRIKARLASYKDGQLTISIGSKRITGTLGDEVKISFASDDPGMAEIGDTVKVKAWYTDASKPVPAFNKIGSGVAENVTITLVKPLAPTNKRGGRGAKTAGGFD